MTDQELLQAYISFVPFLGAVCGPGTEVIVHDVKDLDHSLVRIYNSISGRAPGDPITEMARGIIERGEYRDKDFLYNYTGHTKKRDFLSSTFFIKNDGRLIGLLCVNKDMSACQDLQRSLQVLLERFNLLQQAENEYREDLESPIASMVHNRIADIIAQIGIAPARMSKEEKARAARSLREDGVLSVKGAMAEAAEQLNMSVSTLYRYLSRSDI